MAKFYGIGVGPGDSELLTLKAARVLSDISVLILPEARKSTGSIAWEIAKEHINPEAEIIYMEFPMVTDKQIINEAGAKAAELVAQKVRQGRDTAFITLGDPSIYSTYGYIVRNLDADIEAETIPGITSFCAAAALLNRPLAEGEEILSVIPATAPWEKIEKALEGSGGMAFMKVYSQGQKLLDILEHNELLDGSVMIKRCGMEDCSVERDVKAALGGERQYLSIVLSRKEKK